MKLISKSILFSCSKAEMGIVALENSSESSKSFLKLTKSSRVLALPLRTMLPVSRSIWYSKISTPEGLKL